MLFGNPKNQTNAMLLFSNYGPYHVARWQVAVRYFAKHKVNLVPVQVADSEEVYPWESKEATAEIPMITLFPGRRYNSISPLMAAYKMCRYLRQAKISWGAIPGYARPEFLAALLCLRGRGKATVMMFESKIDDFPRQRLKEWTKSRIVRLFGAALVGGTHQAAYAAKLGIPQERIYPGYASVNNQFFADQVTHIRSDSGYDRTRLNLPPKYFLSVGRFVPKKNHKLIIRAFARYRERVGKSGWHLVFCGSGPLADELTALVKELGLESVVNFCGFRQINELPIFYGLAEAFILASSAAEQWGLVVNEAMASGLPVIVSRSCGCAHDLVHDGVNGFTFDPKDEQRLVDLMVEMSSGGLNLREMGIAGQRLVNNWSPEIFAENLWKAFLSSPGNRQQI